MALPSYLSSKSINNQKEDHWIPLADLMTGLMLMFLLISIIFMLKVEADSENVKRLKVVAEQQAIIAVDQADHLKQFAAIYSELREHLYQDLYKEFEPDLLRRYAVLNRDLAIRFEEPEGQFSTGDAAILPKFKSILDTFIPRYIRILASDRYKASIEEIRIEGHTSSYWKDKTPLDAYFANMELSQRRTRSTLQYALMLSEVSPNQNWMKEKITANGLSSSRLRSGIDGLEDQKLSQRVEFRVRLNADERLSRMLREATK